MAHPFNRSIFERLSEEKQQKIECIYHIASILAHQRLPILTTEDFDYLYDKSVEQLETIIGMTRAQHHAAVYPDIEGE